MGNPQTKKPPVGGPGSLGDDVSGRANITTLYKQYANELAIGPASRQKFKPTAEKPKGNKFKNRGK